MKADIEIARAAHKKNIIEIGGMLGIAPGDLMLFGNYKAKVPLSYIDREKAEKSTLILISSISPTPAGEGKTTLSIGLSMALNRLGKRAVAVLREPSMGPVFGIKGGATGGGHSQLLPMEDINLHFTGDFSAVEKAHNLLAAMIENNIQNKVNNLGIDPRTVSWRRIMDMNDRSLRKIIVGLGGSASGIPRETGFDITAGSEVMATLCLAENLQDLKRRLGNIFVGFTWDRKPVFASDIKANGAMAVLLRDAVMPNLVQTIENTPALVHGGPFANIAQGTNSVISTRMGLSLADYVVTEAGFGFDLGAEKFYDIKCGYSGLSPKAAVVVASVRALKYHGGMALQDLQKPGMEYLKKGIGNLEKHIENTHRFRICAVAAINRFESDTEEELHFIREACADYGVQAVVADVWSKGSEGALDLARTVVRTAETCVERYRPLYDWNWDVETKIGTVARELYGASYVDYTRRARADLKKISDLGFDKLPICIAKTQKSLSDNPDLLGRPKDFVVTVREIGIASGAGFLIPVTGPVMRMPGLPEFPPAEEMDIDEEGNITGLK